MSVDSTVTLPRYEYVGEHGTNPDVISAAEAFLRNPDIDTQVRIRAIETPSADWYHLFSALGDAVIDLGHTLDIELEDRARGPGFFHLYNEAEYDKVRQQFGLAAGSVAVHSTSGHLLFMEASVGVMGTLSRANHELVHAAARKSIRPVVSTDGEGKIHIDVPRSRDGYANWNTDTCNAINEVMTEMTNIDLMSNFWKAQPGLNELEIDPHQDLGYLPHLMLFDELFRDRFTDPLATFKNIQKGMFIGNMKALQPLTRAVGVPIMRRLVAMDGKSAHEPFELADELGYKDVKEKVMAHETSDLLDWL